MVMVTVKDGLAVLGFEVFSAAQTTPTVLANIQNPAHTQAPFFFMTLPFALAPMACNKFSA
jgi:hypothetical protein